MLREIDILTWYVREGFVLVEKATNQVWTLPEVLKASPAEHLHDEDRLRPPEPHTAIGGTFPGCLQQMGASETAHDYKLIGHTRHFLIYGPEETTSA